MANSDWSSIREAYEQGRHAVVANPDGTHQARNPGQSWLTRFDGHGFTATPDGGGWTWGLELKSYGYPGHALKIAGAPAVKADGGRLEYQHDGNLCEWFINDSRGLEQGWTLQHRPVGSETGTSLKLEIGVRGGLEAQVASGGEAVSFMDPSGSNVIQYSSLKAWDADGKSVPVSFEPGDDGFRVVADDANAIYPITIDPIAQQASLKASNFADSDRFGCSVAVSGYTVVVGADHEDGTSTGVNGTQTHSSYDSNQGAAYVFVRSGTTWTQQAYLKASNSRSAFYFGNKVAISGDTMVVGAPGQYWGEAGINGNQNLPQGGSTGAAYIFVRNGSTWVQQAFVKASNAESNDTFGCSVSISSNTVVIGAAGESSAATGVNGNQTSNLAPRAGAAYVFVRDGVTWSQQAYLKASNARHWMGFGYSVAVSADTIVVGSPYENTNPTGVNGNQDDHPYEGTSYGSAYVFARSGTTWSQQAYLKDTNNFSYAEFGMSVAIYGNTVVVGAPGEGNGVSGINSTNRDFTAGASGAAFVFVRSGSTWSRQAYLKASNFGAQDNFGISVSIAGDTVVVGAQEEDSNATGVNGVQSNNLSPSSGAAYVFVRALSTWSQQGYLKASNHTDFRLLGNAVAISGGTAVLGAPYEFFPNQPEFPSSGAATIIDGLGSWFSLSIIAANGATVGAGDYKIGSLASLSATPNAGYVFSSWTGDASGTSNSLQVVVNSNKIVTANFTPDTLDSDGDGLSNYIEIVVQGTNPNVADTDGDGFTDGYEVQFSSNPKSVSSMPTFALSLVNSGTISGGSFVKSGSLVHGTNATVTATPTPGYQFASWTGSATGNINPLILLMDSDKSVGATFVPDTRDPDGDELDNYNEILVHGTNPNVADTDADGYSDGYEVQFSANPKDAVSVPTFTLTLANGGSALGGSFAKSGSLAHGKIAIVTATPVSGYVFGSWSGNGSGAINPLALLMDSNKTVGASFVGDTGDSDGDGLDNYNEIVVLGTNPERGDTDRDGVADGVEIDDKTNPKIADTDQDGLADGLEKKLEFNPLRKDSDSDGTADADEDRDRDGISNGREVNELGTNPFKTDSDGDGLTDTFELAFDGETDPFSPRIGDRIRLDFKRLNLVGTLYLAGKLPKGLRFDPVKQVLEGTLEGKAGSYSLNLELFSGRTYDRRIHLPLAVAAFPDLLAGSYDGLIENLKDHPTGRVSVDVTTSGTWTATLDVAGSAEIRTASGLVSLNPAEDSARLVLPFQAENGLDAANLILGIQAESPLVNGSVFFNRSGRPGGFVRGFRLADGSRETGKDRHFTMVIDQGERDGLSVPAGLGWATGSVSNSGEISLSGRLGDSASFQTSSKMSATGQAIIWVKPYRNLASRLGGIISFRESGLALEGSRDFQEPGIAWFRERDNSELSYPNGFGPLQAHAGITAFSPPASAGALAKSLGLIKKNFGGVMIEGGGLPDPKGEAVLPSAFALSDSYDLLARDGSNVPWRGAISPDDGTFAGTLKLPPSRFGIAGGAARASGVLIPRAGFIGIVAAGLVEVPVDDRKGAFRTAAIVISQ